MATRTRGNDNDGMATCAFCGKSADEANSMIAGPDGIYLCDECVAVCSEVMMRDLQMKMQSEMLCLTLISLQLILTQKL